MCGIIGYIGRQHAASVLLTGLSRLEYRGYDNAGLAIIEDKKLGVRKVGEKDLSGLYDSLELNPLFGTVGIGHTRWATHGDLAIRNAHPHVAGSVAVVHNGIVENHDALRGALCAEGRHFESHTDTEVIPHLIERELRWGAPSLETAVARALSHVEGAYAIAVVSADHPDELVAACNSSPLVVGIGKNELYIASDELALAGKVDAVAHLKDGELAVLKRNGSYTFSGLSLKELSERLEKPASQEAAYKGGYEHFMRKEIDDQPQAVRNTLAGRLREAGPIVLGGIAEHEGRLADARRLMLVGCGTSLFAAQAGKILIEKLAHMLCEAEQAAEFAYRSPPLQYGDAVIGISQSGETADTLKALDLAKRRHALTLGITNRVGSSLAKRARAGLYLHAGPEVAVASTKAFTSQVVALTLLALRLAELRGHPIELRLRHWLLRAPELLNEQLLANEKRMRELATQWKGAQRMIIIGRGTTVPLAYEAALKIREIAYLDAHGLSAAELKHGTLALVEQGTPVLALMPQGELRSKMASNLAEVRTRGGEVEVVQAPDHIPDELLPVVLAPAVQLLAYHLGVARGVDVDRPRNLAKAVTVE